MPDCPNCGKHVSAEAPYCLSCGAAQQPEGRALQQSSPEPQQPMPPQAPESPQPLPLGAVRRAGRGAAVARAGTRRPRGTGRSCSVRPPGAKSAAHSGAAECFALPRRRDARPPQGQGLPGWAIALIVVAVLLVTGLPVAIVIFSFVTVGNVVEVAPP